MTYGLLTGPDKRGYQKIRVIHYGNLQGLLIWLPIYPEGIAYESARLIGQVKMAKKPGQFSQANCWAKPKKMDRHFMSHAPDVEKNIKEAATAS